ncbi:putative hydrolase YtnL [Paenibacillus sp. J31TS4]|uniref:M20 metallopeptidase family protein n=1 Tax=Paenibacillus sp. J31TS4 TaxID=2807195 RepID=UPI001B13AC04|nr:M20 family metallopeptidase [Paenibacillus sp. J31TS4]GIP37268.1 putative hydrolase YtnL [Paenibacillus sp. J31TS4]
MIQTEREQELLTAGKALEASLVAVRRELHRHPELSLKEARTAALVAERLTELGLPVQTNVGGYGVVAELAGGRPGPTVALRADMDALPIEEETGLPFASEHPGVMHACGHDAHTAMLLGAAELLTARRDELAGTVRFLFQAAEEVNAGAKGMIADGALEGVSEIYGLHNLPTLAAGKVATRYGSLMGSVDRIELTLEGKGGHGAIPDQSIDPVVSASAIVMALQTAASREISPFDPVVVTIGSLRAGEANNVIPHRAELTGTVRTFSPRVQAGMKERLERIVTETAAAYRCHADFRYIEQNPVLVSHDLCVQHVEETADRLLGAENRVEAAPTMAGEDFAVYLTQIPGAFFWLGSGPEENAEQAYGLHHPKFDVNETCLPTGASLLAAIAASRLEALGGRN